MLVRTSWVAVDDEPSSPVAVVWMGDLRTPDPRPPPVQASAARVPVREPGPVPQREDEPPAEPASVPLSESEAAPLSEPDAPPPSEPDAPALSEPDAPALAESERPPADSQPPGADVPARSFILREADLEEAWRRAREQLEQEENYLTFSLDDAIEQPPPEEPGPSESIFEAAERFGSRGGPSILAPNGARTRVGRALAEFCNALTGGFGISLGPLNLGSVCADPQESAKLFAHLKPAYLRSRPVCTEVESAGGVSADAAPVIKCRLVLEEEMDQVAND